MFENIENLTKNRIKKFFKYNKEYESKRLG